MLVEVAEDVLGADELNHCDARRYVDRVDVVAVDKRVERLADEIVLLAGRVHCLVGVRLLVEEHFEVLNWLWAHAKTCQCLLNKVFLIFILIAHKFNLSFKILPGSSDFLG